uniref:Uncharacterized protein n=1 Tax=Rhizophora mucronata TaxID=61149 RepID=A0A2P2Q938_RHIMU
MPLYFCLYGITGLHTTDNDYVLDINQAHWPIQILGNRKTMNLEMGAKFQTLGEMQILLLHSVDLRHSLLFLDRLLLSNCLICGQAMMVMMIEGVKGESIFVGLF